MLETLIALALGILASFGLVNNPAQDISPSRHESALKAADEIPDASSEAQEMQTEPTSNINGYPVVGG